MTTANTSVVVAPVVSKTQARKALAESVFKNAGKSQKDITNLMNTINFSKPVQTIELVPGDYVWRYERFNAKIDAEKHFFTDAFGADVGATGVGFSEASGYNLVTYQVTVPTKVLKSTIRNSKTIQYFSTELQKNIKQVPDIINE